MSTEIKVFLINFLYNVLKNKKGKTTTQCSYKLLIIVYAFKHHIIQCTYDAKLKKNITYYCKYYIYLVQLISCMYLKTKKFGV